MMQVFIGARIFDGFGFHADKALVVDGARVRALVAYKDRPAGDVVDLGGGVLAPGFVDWQVNGGGGVLFNADPSPETIAAIVTAHRRFGTTALVPTIITDAAQVLTAALAAQRVETPGALGVHVEGPYIDVRRKGVHPERHIRKMGEAEMRQLIAARRGSMVVTLAPCAASLDAINQLAMSGILVSVGHAEATAEEAFACFDAGARAVTHLYNAMSQLGSRAPGLVGAALADPRVTAGFIADGHHVDDVAGRVAYLAKGANGLSLISDAMPPAAGGPPSFQLERGVATRDGLRLALADGTLAGAAITMLDAVRYTTTKLTVPLADALAMATSTPARLLGVDAEHGALRPGAFADLVHLSENLDLHGVWFHGVRSL
jgi:N-acetylglucosamine-6-phosphate deacetylase